MSLFLCPRWRNKSYLFIYFSHEQILGLVVVATVVSCRSVELSTRYGAPSLESCDDGLERNIYGKCVSPSVSQNLFLFRAPDYTVPWEEASYEHTPKVHVNLVFIRSPSYEDKKRKPIIVPPPKQQTLVYLLSKKPSGFKQDIIEVPVNHEKPEVFFVDYKEGDNPLLPGGIDLQTALSQSSGSSSSSGLNIQSLGVQTFDGGDDGSSEIDGGGYGAPPLLSASHGGYL